MSDDGTSGAADDGGSQPGDGRPGDDQPANDPERAALLRDVAREIRGDSDESERVAAILFRVSDIYDTDEETDPESVYRNMRTILQISERGTLERDRD